MQSVEKKVANVNFEEAQLKNQLGTDIVDSVKRGIKDFENKEKTGENGFNYIKTYFSNHFPGEMPQRYTNFLINEYTNKIKDGKSKFYASCWAVAKTKREIEIDYIYAQKEKKEEEEAIKRRYEIEDPKIEVRMFIEKKKAEIQKEEDEEKEIFEKYGDLAKFVWEGKYSIEKFHEKLFNKGMDTKYEVFQNHMHQSYILGGHSEFYSKFKAIYHTRIRMLDDFKKEKEIQKDKKDNKTKLRYF